jgi:hypothetical protein
MERTWEGQREVRRLWISHCICNHRKGVEEGREGRLWLLNYSELLPELTFDPLLLLKELLAK